MSDLKTTTYNGLTISADEKRRYLQSLPTDVLRLMRTMAGIRRRTLRSNGSEFDVITNWCHEVLDPEIGIHGYDPIQFQRHCLAMHNSGYSEIQYTIHTARLANRVIEEGRKQGDLFGKEPAR